MNVAGRLRQDYQRAYAIFVSVLYLFGSKVGAITRPYFFYKKLKKLLTIGHQ